MDRRGRRAFALTVFTGLHTFLGFVREAFPINHFLQVAVLVLIAVPAARSRPRPVVDIAVNLIFVAACLTLRVGHPRVGGRGRVASRRHVAASRIAGSS